MDLVRSDARRDERPGSAKIPAGRCRWRCSPPWRMPSCGFGPPSAWRSNWCSRSSRPRSAGRRPSTSGLARTLFSWTLHAIVYFWLIPAYIAFYTMVPRAAGGRLYSDTMGRLTFILFLVYSLPVGMHHLLMDPEHGNGTKFIQVLLTAFVSVPTLLTIFTITASLEIAGRLRGGRGLFGWIAALPWERPMVLATGLGFVMLGFGGFGGLINMGYGMNAMVHNTSWVTAHFHLIFGGSVVIMYFAIAYEIWPRLTGREHASLAPLRAAAVAVVFRHDGDDAAVALARPAGTMASRRQFQLRRSDHRQLGAAGDRVFRGRLRAARVGAVVCPQSRGAAP